MAQKSGRSNNARPARQSAVWGGAVIGFLRTDGARLVRFAISGLTAAGVYFAVLALCLSWTGIRADLASVIAYLASLIFSYLLQSRFTFQARDDSARQVVAFVIVSLTGLALSWVVMAVLHLRIGVPVWWVAIILCGIIPTTNYFLFKWVVFTQNTGLSGTPRD